jgi:hypothetical protein
MKLSADAVIAREKLTQYLLVPQPRGDKSAFLALAGYTLGNHQQLLSDLRTQILPLEAQFLERNQFGELYEIIGDLRGPNVAVLHIRTIWMIEHLSGATKFITLVPEKRST